MIDIEKLNAFLAVNDAGSFSAAAHRLHISQSTISKYILELERELGVKLFDRTTTGTVLTSAGETLLPWAQRLVRQTIELEELMMSLQNKVAGTLRIACSTTAGKYILPKLTGRFCKHYPNIHVTILRCTPEHLGPTLLEGESDLGVVSSEVCNRELECQHFFDDTINLIVPGSHPWAVREAIEPEELIDEPMILREPTSGTRRVLLQELAKFDIKLEDLNVFMELGNAEAIVETVASGYGVSFVSRLAYICHRQLGSVVEIPVKGLNLKRQLYMIRSNKNILNRAQETFWSFVNDPANEDIFNTALG